VVALKPATPEVAIDIRGLGRRYGNFIALQDFDLAVPRGAFFALLGPNGAGKTTLLRMLTGLLPPSTGDAWIEGHSIRTAPLEVKRCIGVVPDELALFDRLTFWEHLTLVARIHGLPRDTAAERAAALLQTFELEDARGLFPPAGSQGMRKKLALAMALVHGPKVLFLDEPFESIDPIAGKMLRDLLHSLAASGVTIFLTSHILEVVERLADEFAIVAHGQLVHRAAMRDIHAAGQSLEEVFVTRAGVPKTALEKLTWLL
jgi:ABC-2 type transport system ATP-binding protein